MRVSETLRYLAREKERSWQRKMLIKEVVEAYG